MLVVSVGLTVGSAVSSALGLGLYPQPSTAVAAGIVERPVGDPGSAAPPAAQPVTPPAAAAADPEPGVPAGSGTGRRVVFDMSDQRVWLVHRDESVRHTYLVSGSRVDNLDAGSYEVYSRSLHATGFTGATTMDYMVRFTAGERAAIGFHDIPRDAAGERVQGFDELGTATSAGCIRQRTVDARVLWRFAPVGTPVVVVE